MPWSGTCDNASHRLWVQALCSDQAADVVKNALVEAFGPPGREEAAVDHGPGEVAQHAPLRRVGNLPSLHAGGAAAQQVPRAPLINRVQEERA